MFGKRFSRALVVTTAASLVMAAAAFADNTVADGDGMTPVGANALAFGNVDCGVEATKSALIAISRSGSGTNTFANNATVTVSVSGVTGDGLSASIPAAANTITLPSNWTGLANNTLSAAVTASVKLTSATEGGGSGSVTFRATGLNTSGATINRSDTMSVSWTTGSCAPANTAPSVSVGGVSNGASYEFGSVPAATCNVTDTEDGNSSFNATLSAISGSLASYGLGSQTASCSYTDGGGLSASASATYSIVDTGAPTITNLGPTPESPNGSNSWYTTAVTNTFRAADSGAGFASPLTNPHEFTKDSGSAEGAAVIIASGAVSDAAGNSAASIDSAAFKIDLSDPYNVAFVGGPAAGSSYVFGNVPAAPTCDADDAISGLANCIVTGHSSAVGSHTMTATATDNAGRTATATRQYTVLAWSISGFYRPVDMEVLNSAKAGSTIPLKFEVFAGTTELTDTAIVKTFTQKIACDTTGTPDPIEEYATGNTSLRYDSTGGQFIFNWKTPSTKGCYRVTLETQDGTKIFADFQLK